MKQCKLFPSSKLSVDIPKHKEYLTNSALCTHNNSSTVQSLSTKDNNKRKGLKKTIILSILNEKHQRCNQFNVKNNKYKSRNKTKVILFQSKDNDHNGLLKSSKSAIFYNHKCDSIDYDFFTPEDNQINKLLDRKIKFQQLKTDIILLKHKDKYLLNNIWNEANDNNNHKFIRKLKSNDKFKSKSKNQYDKEKVCNTKEDEKYKLINKKYLYLHNIQREASRHSRQLTKDINKEKTLWNISSTKKPSNTMGYKLSNTSFCKSELELIKRNADKVKMNLDRNSQCILHQTVNTIIYEDQFFNRVDRILSDKETKAIVNQMNDKFKKIGSERTCLKKLLKLKAANWRITNKGKMINKINNYRIDYIANDYLKEESNKSKVMKTLFSSSSNKNKNVFKVI